MRKVIVLAIVSAALMVSACNTFRGLGQDVQAAGEGVECSAQGRC